MGRYSAVNQYRLPFLVPSGRKEGVEGGSPTDVHPVPDVVAAPADVVQMVTTGNADADASASRIYLTTKTAVDTATSNVLSATKAAADKAAVDVLTAAQTASVQAAADVLNATKAAVEQAAKEQAIGDLADSNTIKRLYYIIALLVLVLMGGGWYTYSLRNAYVAAVNPSASVAGTNSA